MSKIETNIPTRQSIRRRVRALMDIKCVACDHMCSHEPQIDEVSKYVEQCISQTSIDTVKIAFGALADNPRIVEENVFQAVQDRLRQKGGDA